MNKPGWGCKITQSFGTGKGGGRRMEDGGWRMDSLGMGNLLLDIWRFKKTGEWNL